MHCSNSTPCAAKSYNKDNHALVLLVEKDEVFAHAAQNGMSLTFNKENI